MGTYYVPTTAKIVDGATFCGGSPCTASDIIIIEGGTRGNLLFKDFNGNGSYIPITNENADPDDRVIITTGSVGETYAGLELRDCKYLDLKGNNDADLKYGIKVIYDGTPIMASAVRVRQESDHIKIGYIEIDDANSVTTATGLLINDNTLSSNWIFDTFEIHHNYIYGVGYAGLYLGQNSPWSLDNPYISNVSVHDNIMEDMGAYGVTLKGVHSSSGVCSIYNNVVKRTGLINTSDGSAWHGIGVVYFAGDTYANIYNNWIEKTKGAGLKIGDQNHNVYGNLVLGCGTGNEERWGHGIVTYNHADGVNIYDNIIIQPTRYGIYGLSGAEIDGTTISRNLIGDAGLGEWGEEFPGRIIESTGADANIYHANVADFGFKAWSDDGDYGNDDFTFPIPSAKGHIVDLTYPVSVGHGAVCDIDAAIKNIGELSGVFKMQMFINEVLKATSPTFTLAGGETSADKINSFTAPSAGDSMDVIIKCIRST